MAAEIILPGNVTAEEDSIATTSVLVPKVYSRVTVSYVSSSQTEYDYYNGLTLVATLRVIVDSSGRLISVERI